MEVRKHTITLLMGNGKENELNWEKISILFSRFYIYKTITEPCVMKNRSDVSKIGGSPSNHLKHIVFVFAEK